MSSSRKKCMVSARSVESEYISDKNRPEYVEVGLKDENISVNNDCKLLSQNCKTSPQMATKK